MALLLLTAGAYLIVQYNPALAYHALISTQPPERADVIYMLGGDWERRGPVAIDLWRAGYAPRIAVAQEPPARNHESQSDMALRMLKQRGVPDSAILTLAPATAGVQSTADEAFLVAAYADALQWRRVLLVTSYFHTRRTGWTFRRIAPSSVEFRVIGAPEEWTPGEAWPQTPLSRSIIEKEWVKLPYYMLRYGLLAVQ